MGYTSVCDPAKIIHAVQTGVNVLFWFSIDLVDDNGKPAIVPSAVQPLPNISCIVNTANKLRQLNLPTTHMVTVGGWGAPDPVTTFTATEMWNAWKDWNTLSVAAEGLPGGFDGIDWDMEGANDPSAPSNYVSPEMLDLVGQMSQLAKIDGFIVSVVPPESYLDQTTSQFDGSLLHSYPEWESIVDFNYHGHNCYAYLLAKYGTTIVEKDTANSHGSSGQTVQTFDIVSIQLYESYTHMDYNVTAAPAESQQTPSEYLTLWVPKVLGGWMVDFSSAPEYGITSQNISVQKTALCIGIANGWADNIKNILIMPNEAEIAYNALAAMNQEPRGFVFWAIDNEGQVPPNQDLPLFMASGLNKFLHTRP